MEHIFEIQKIGVLGAGQMGRGIAQCAAQSSMQVLLADQSKAVSEKGKEQIARILRKQVEKGKLTEEKRQLVLEKICPVSGIEAFDQVDFVIEAISENPELKFSTFKQLDSIVPKHAILASNTSSISLTKIASCTKRPEQVVGMHFMNPVPVMKLVEGIRAIQCSEKTFALMKALAEKMGKIVVEAKDFPGFAVNRVLVPMINEAIWAYQEGVATKEDIDQAMKLGTHHPMGPFELADFVGLDTLLAILRVMQKGLGDPKYRPAPILIQHVEATWLGRKTGRGFYIYNKK